ncbi:MAG: RHS repeat protein, partial [Candidatus Thiodiazotropha sp. (ex Lucinoma borealis)]|nr:RHS repeat protein [Candidatus Thiodiazotropha sp. (ex Lucinoma borealis)]
MRYPAMTRATRFGLLLCLNIGLCLNTALADRTTTYTYTAQGQVETIDGPRIDVTDITTYGYDTQGNRTSITNALGQATQITAHDAAGRPLTILSPNNLTTILSYDARGRLTQQSLSDSVTTRTTLYGYDAVGNLTQVTQPDGSFLSYEYDPAHRLIGMEDNQGNRIDYTLDAMGNRLTEQVRDPQGTLMRTQQRVYDELGQIHQLIDSQSQNTVYDYDANGNTTQTTDANLNPSNQAYDPLDRLKQQTDALNGLTQYQYDAQDNPISVTDPNGLATTYTYDGLGNLTQLNSPDTGTTTYTYDEAGNRLSQSDARGITVTYSYDALNRLTAIHYPDTSLDVSYTYDQGVHGIGQLTSMSDALGSTNYVYNAYGNLTSQTRTSLDSITTTFGYAYDPHGRLATLTYSSGKQVHTSYDAQGQLNSLTLEEIDGTTRPLVSNLQRLPFGSIQALDYGNGLHLTRTFDQDYRLIAQALPGVLTSSYDYDPVGNISEWLDSAHDQVFDYDKLDRLINASGNYGDLGYSYDATGNRLTQTEGIDTET